MDASYLKEMVGNSLAKGLAEVSTIRPADPIEYLASWLLKHEENVVHRQNNPEPKLRVNVCAPSPVRFTVAKAGGLTSMDQVAPPMDQVVPPTDQVVPSADQIVPPTISVPPDTPSQHPDGSKDTEPSRERFFSEPSTVPPPDSEDPSRERFFSQPATGVLDVKEPASTRDSAPATTAPGEETSSTEQPGEEGGAKEDGAKERGETTKTEEETKEEETEEILARQSYFSEPATMGAHEEEAKRRFMSEPSKSITSDTSKVDKLEPVKEEEDKMEEEEEGVAEGVAPEEEGEKEGEEVGEEGGGDNSQPQPPEDQEGDKEG